MAESPLCFARPAEGMPMSLFRFAVGFYLGCFVGSMAATIILLYAIFS